MIYNLLLKTLWRCILMIFKSAYGQIELCLTDGRKLIMLDTYIFMLILEHINEI